jgi:hypothetical protein
VSRAQRLTFLAIAAVIAIGAVILLSAAGEEEQPTATGAQATAPPEATASAAPGATETATAEATPVPQPAPPLITPGKQVDLRVNEGETVRFRVRADTTDEVHVHGYDLMKQIAPGRTVSFSFKADIVGIFTIELESAGDEIAQLRVDPA